MYVQNRTKIANFPTPLYLTPPMKGFPVEFGIGVRGPKCLNDGPTRWSKKFSDRFSRFDTIPAVTDTPASQPASHVAVAITLNAKASSLKTSHDLRYLRVIPLLVQYTILIVYSDRIFRMTGREGAIYIYFSCLVSTVFLLREEICLFPENRNEEGWRKVLH